MKRAVLKRLTSLVACLLVVAIVSPNFVYSVKASAHEGNAGVEIEAPESKETESEKAKETKADSDKKTAKETKTVKETKADSEETKAKETEAKETEAKAEETKTADTKATESKATEAKAADKSEETKASETEQAKESEKAEPSETEKPAETSAESKETVPSETAEETKPSESAEPSESSESSETKEEPQPSESVPAESSETSESSEETEPSETSESSAAETATAASIKVAEDAEEFIKFVASLPEQYRLIIDTDKDLSSLKGAKGVFYDGSYVLVFDGIDNYDAALKYLNSKKISFSIDGSVELCGVTIKCNNVTVNPNAKTKIAIIDTGSSLANEKVSVMGDKGEDKNGHGTSMASAVLAQSDDAYIISIKAIDDDGTGKVADVYAALQYAIEADCKVILMAISLRDLGQYEAFKSLVADAVSKGIKVVASAGNNGTDASKYIPAGLKDVLTAGAMDEQGVKLPKSNYGKCVDYYVVADSTSEAAAILAGKVIAGKTDDLATTCKMSASEGKDDARAKFKVNRSDDPGSNDFSSNNGETLYNNAAAFCIFTKEFIHSNHMEGSVAADKYTRKTDSIMEITPRIFPYTYDANYYFYFNSINQDPVDQKMISQSPDEGKPYASMYLGPDLVYVEPEKTVDGNYQITVDNQTIAVPNDLANNGNGRFIYSYSQKKIVGSGNNPTTISGGGTVKASSKIDFDSVLTKIGNWAKDFYDKHDLKLSDYTPNGYEYTIQLHDGVNYINLTEDQLNNYGFDFVPSSSGKCSIVINVVDDGDGIVNLSHDEANKRVTYNKIGIPEATKESLTAASHILFNFHKDIHTVNLGKSTTTELGTLLAPGADLTIASTHDGNAIAKSFKNDSVEIHQAAFPFVGKNASSTGKVTIKKNFTHPGDEDLGANTVFKIYEGNYRSVDELKGATGTTMTRSGNTYTASMTVAGPYTIRETTTPDNYNGLGSTLIHITLKADGSVELDSPKSATNITVDSASTEKNLTLKVENSRKKASTAGSVSLKKIFTGFFPMDARSATFKVYYGKFTDINKLDDSALVPGCEKTFTYNDTVNFTGLDEVGPYTIVETGVSANIEKVDLIYLNVAEDGKVTFDNVPTGVKVTTNNSTSAAIEVENKKKAPVTVTVSFSKKDMTGEGSELAGAKMELTAGIGTMVNWNTAYVSGPVITGAGQKATWTSGSEQLKIKLPAGTYTLKETTAPDGYDIITTTTFTVDASGKITKTTSNTDVTIEGNVVTAFDAAKKTYEVSISKKDITKTGSELAGASMKLTATGDTSVNWNKARKSGPAITANGKAIIWTSGTAPLVLNLPDGTYQLEETATLKIGGKEYTRFTTATFSMTNGVVTETTVKDDSTVTFTGTDNRTVTAFDTPVTKTADVNFSKKDFADKSVANANELTGAEMKLTATEGDATTWTADDWAAAKKEGPAVTMVSGEKAVTWTSTSTQLKISLPDGKYTLTENAAPAGYGKITSFSFEIKDGKVTSTATSETVTLDNTTNTVTAFDKLNLTETTFSKKDFANKTDANAEELVGAKMQLTAKSGKATTWTADDWATARKAGPAVSKVDGKSAVTWTSTSTQLKINLPDGDYELEEIAAPNGYKVITKLSFKVENGKVTATGTASETTAVDSDKNLVTAFDKLVVCEVSISKKDIVDENNANAKELAGAKMTLTANSGVAASWTSDQWKAARKSGPAITVSGATVTWTSGGSDLMINLPDGQYTLVEDTAPDGYGKITAFEFTVSNGKVVSKETKEVTADGNTNTVTAFDTLKTSTVTFSKKDFADKEKDNAEELAGAKMKLTAVSGPATSWDSNRWKSAKTQGPAVSKVDGESAATWISGSVQLKLSLPDGTYKLEETTPPTDYSVITEITFTIKDGKVENKSNETVTVNGSNNVVTAFDKAKETPTPTPATVYISKKDMADKGKVNANELSGAKMKLTAVSGDATTWDADDWNDAQADGPDVSKVNGASAIEWTSGTKQLKINLPDGQYTLSEDKAPNGYNVITELTFEIKDGKVVSSSNTSVTADGDTNTVTAFDELKKVADVVFSKKDFANKGKENANELTGATLKLTAVSGDAASWTAEDWTKAKKEGPAVSKVSGENAVTWTSATTQLKISLPDGKYTLTENAAPAGYDKITEFSFEIKDGKVTSTATSETVTLDNTTNTVTAFDKLTTCKTAISKKDMADKGKENASELSGAAMKLTATEGKAVSWTEEQWKAARVSGPAISVSGAEISWTSGTEQLMINLPDGKYTLSETTPPSKYVAITDMTFEIKDGKVVNATSETVTADAATNTVTAFDKAESTPTPAPADVVFSKKDFADKNKDNAEELTGATLKLTAVSGDAAKWTAEDWTKAKKEGPSVSKVTGENAVTWTSSSTQLKIGLPDGTYKLEENGAPAGYDEITAITFTVENGKVTGTSSETVTLDGTKNVVTAFDKATKTYETAFSKKDFADKNKDNAEELPGASMKLTATEGKAASWTEELWKAARVSGPAISVSGASITWTSGNAQLLINLPDGKYTLSETTPPSTHTAITDIEFEIKGGKVTGTSSETVTLDGTKNVVTAFDKAKDTPTPAPADIVFSKKDFADKGNENADELTGATLKLTAVSGDASKWKAEDWTKAQKDGPSVSKVTGENAVTWTSDTTQLKIALPDGTYTLEEDGTPAGYEEITKITFTIESGKVTGQSSETVSLDGTKNVITAFDKLRITDIAFSKKDFADKGKDNAKELVGATMKLTAKSGAATKWSGDDWDDAKTHGPMIKMVTGEKAVTWTSSSEQLLIGLPDGEYELEEKAAPNNYGVITKLQFKIVEGKVSADGTTDETTSIDDTNKVITAFDKATTVTGDVSISKKDMADKDKTNANELSGATMQLTAVSGDAANWTAEDWTKAQKDGPSVSKVTDANAITWTSGTTALKISLPDGKYELKENLAPAGYKVITTTTFELKDGKVVTSKSATVEADGNTNTVTAFDELRITDIAFSKKDFTDKGKDNADELTGAKMKLTAVSGPATKWSNADWVAAQKEGPVFSKDNSEAAIEWISATTQFKIGLPDGDYMLSETQSPDDKYDLITTLNFTIKDGKVTGTTDETTVIDDTNKVITGFDKELTPPAPDTSKVTFSKQDMTQKGKELPNAQMKLSTTDDKIDFSTLTHSGGSDVTVSGDKKSISWKTTKDNQFAVWLPDGTYTLEETVAPNGYNVITKTTFTVKNGKVDSTESTTHVDIDGVNNIITAFDEAKTFEIELSKEDIAKNLIADAVLSITSVDGYDLSKVEVTQGGASVATTLKNGNTTIEFKSSGSAYSKIKGLRVGKYVLTETTAPAKYMVAASIDFEIDNDGALICASVVGSRIVMIDRADPSYFTPVTLNGQDKEDKKDLPDIVITITSTTPTVDLENVKVTGGVPEQQGEKIIRIKTTGGPVELSLPDGEYIIKQISGPDGYEKVPSAPFKVEGGKIVPTGTPVNIDIEDHNITVLLPKTNSGKKTPKGGSVPATGVGVSYTNVAGAALISAAVAAMGICIVVFKKKKQEEI